MEPRQVATEDKWDLVRLQDVRSLAERGDPTETLAYFALPRLLCILFTLPGGRGYAHRVIVTISTYILQCQCVQKLLPFLVKRGVVASKVSSLILSQSDTEAAITLDKLLNARSHEPENQAGMVEGIYLALLDCYEESGNVWCHGMAVNGLRPVGMCRRFCSYVVSHPLQLYSFAVRLELKLPDVNFHGILYSIQMCTIYIQCVTVE